MKFILLPLSILSLSACSTFGLGKEDLKSPCPPGAKYVSNTNPCDLIPINVAQTITLQKKA